MGIDDVQDVNMAGGSDEDTDDEEDEARAPPVVEGKHNGEAAGGEVISEVGNDDNSEPEDSSSEGIDTDSSDDEESEGGRKVEELEQLLAENIYSYDLHVQLISALRKSGQLEKLRAAREAMNALYPLAPMMWKEWAQDEARLVSTTEDVRAVEAIYERGIQDYLSVTLWFDYLKFVEERDANVAENSQEGQSKMRKLYERALAAVGLHFAEGGKVWEAYREFEQAVLLLLSVSGGEGKAKQVEIVRKLFHRQLTIPSVALSQALEIYTAWEREQGNLWGGDTDNVPGIPPHVRSAYDKAKQLCSIREIQEGKIANDNIGETEKLQYYLEYIDIEEASGEPARAQLMFERSVAAFPVNQDIWLKYLQYLETKLKVASVLKSVYARAVRNCPWVERLWKGYLLATERLGGSESEICTVFEQSLQGGFQSAAEYLDLCLTRCDGLRRLIIASPDGSPTKESYIQNLRATFSRASQFLATYYPDFVDRSLQLHAYWADIEVHIAKDLTAARGVWDALIKTSGWMIEVWQAYILMEISLNNIKEARGVYRNCYSRRLEGNGSEMMCSAWLRFEREHGTLEDYDRALVKIGPRIAEIEVMQIKQEAQPVQQFTDPRSVRRLPDAGIKNREHTSASGQNLPHGTSSGSPAAKRKRGLTHERKPKLKKGKTDKDGKLKTRSDGSGKAVKSAGAAGEDVDMDDASQKTLKGSKPPRQYSDECTAFVSNISFEVTVEQLTEFFSSVAGVKEVRLLREKHTGRPRGLAYVDFEDEDSLAAAVSKDQHALHGRKLTIARSAPMASRGRGGDVTQRGGFQGRGRSREEDGHGDSSTSGRGLGLRSGVGHRRGGKVNVTGSNTFAVPRALARPLGWNAGQASTGEEVVKSNDEFRKLLLNKK